MNSKAAPFSPAAGRSSTGVLPMAIGLSALIGLLGRADAQPLEWVQPVSPGAAQRPVDDGAVQPVAYQRPQTHPGRTTAPRRVAKQPTTRTAPRPAPSADRVPAGADRAAAQQRALGRAEPPLADSEITLAAAEGLRGGGDAVQPVCHLCGDGPGCACDPGCAVLDPGCECLPGGCACGDVACGGCGEVVCGDACGPCGPRGIPVCFYLPPVENLVLFSGVQGFKNPLDGYRDRGNFGFNAGVNLGGPVPWFPKSGIGYQVGYRATFNQLNGSRFGSDGQPVNVAGPLNVVGDADSHTQSFVTGGLFRRNECGLQYGVVYDYLQDDRIESVDFNQVRGQISITNPKGGEIGFLFASGVNEQVINLSLQGAANNASFQASDQYLAFYRFNAAGGGEFRVLAGGDSDSRGILGAEMLAPLNHSWTINTGFRYFTASDSAAGVGSTQEAWNLGIDLVYHFRGAGKRWHNSPWRPLFGVADNSSLSVNQLN